MVLFRRKWNRRLLSFRGKPFKLSTINVNVDQFQDAEDTESNKLTGLFSVTLHDSISWNKIIVNWINLFCVGAISTSSWLEPDATKSKKIWKCIGHFLNEEQTLRINSDVDVLSRNVEAVSKEKRRANWGYLLFERATCVVIVFIYQCCEFYLLLSLKSCFCCFVDFFLFGGFWFVSLFAWSVHLHSFCVLKVWYDCS